MRDVLKKMVNIFKYKWVTLKIILIYNIVIFRKIKYFTNEMDICGFCLIILSRGINKKK